MKSRFERSDSPWKIALIYAALLLMAGISVYPILNILSMSLRPDNTLYSTSLRIIPANATLDNYRTMIFEKPLPLWMWNSMIVSVATAAISVAVAATAGYALSRFRFLGGKGFMVFLLTTQMFPATMLLLPTYLLLARLNLLETLQGLIIPYTATAVPFSVWMMKGFYDTIPRELEQSAYIDGAGNFTAFFRVILPLASPALAITALFSFMTGWSEYLVARVVLTKAEMYTLPVGLVTLQSSFNTEWGRYSAGALLTMIPVTVIFVLLSRYLVGGLTLGSVKG